MARMLERFRTSPACVEEHRLWVQPMFFRMFKPACSQKVSLRGEPEKN